jgi:hypothetical protein
MRYLLVEAVKDEKRRGLLTEHEINEKYRNSFSYQTARLVFDVCETIEQTQLD